MKKVFKKELLWLKVPGQGQRKFCSGGGPAGQRVHCSKML
jgi:hypothetical protein